MLDFREVQSALLGLCLQRDGKHVLDLHLDLLPGLFRDLERDLLLYLVSAAAP